MKKILLILGIAIIATGVFIVASRSLKLQKNQEDGSTKVELEALQPLTDDQLKEQIGQMIMIGFRGTEALENGYIYNVIKDIKLGGVVLFDYDVPLGSFPRNITGPQQVKKLISNIQGYSKTPLFVAVDAEGGSVNRLKKEYGFLPIVSAEKMGTDKTLQTTHKESTELAGELKSLGFNMNLAPVVDVNINPKSPAIGALGRSFSSDPKEVVSQSRVFIQNHLKNNIITVEKHFPGHGSATGDSHKGITDVTNTYKDEELYPYQILNDEGLLKAVMIAHIINKNIDQDYPATLSSKFIQGILREKIGFDGVIISDDMQMSAISKNYTLDEAIIRSINAGMDVISILNNSPVGYDEKIPYNVRDIIFNAVKEGKIPEEKITASYNRILNLKREFNIVEQTGAEKATWIRSKNFELLGTSEKITFGQALEIAKQVEKSADIRPAFLLSIFQEELKLEKFDMCYLTDFNTGAGARISDGKKLARVMKPDRDIEDFKNLMGKLGKDPFKTPITCPMSFGWGGAMGPADFIPSTWMKYKDKIEKITGKVADPWNIEDAFLAAGLYLSDSGAKTKTEKGERDSAMIYFSGSINSPYTWYANGAIIIAKEIQIEIDALSGF